MVYVDELRAWPQRPTPGAERWFGNGKESCHLTADTVAELHAFADRIGLQRAWFQPQSSPHYDLTPQRRAAALQAGAVFVSALDQARARITARRAAATGGSDAT